MIILGIDPGYAIVGVGVIEYNGNKFKVLDYFAITTEAHTPFDKRLKTIYDGLCEVIHKYKPDYMSIEELFFNDNAKTAIAVGQARGVILLAAANNGVEIFEYTPGFVHAKVFLCDDAEAVVGTINLDYRSLYHHFECATY